MDIYALARRLAGLVCCALLAPQSLTAQDNPLSYHAKYAQSALKLWLVGSAHPVSVMRVDESSEAVAQALRNRRLLRWLGDVAHFVRRMPLGAAGAAIIVLMVVCAVLAPVIAPYYGARPSPSFDEFQKLGAAAVLYPSLTTANGLQATWELLHEFKEGGPGVLEEWNRKAEASKWGMVPRTQDPILPAEKIRRLEEEFIPGDLRRDYEKTFGHNRH